MCFQAVRILKVIVFQINDPSNLYLKSFIRIYLMLWMKMISLLIFEEEHAQIIMKSLEIKF